MQKFDFWRFESDNGRQRWRWTPEFEERLSGDLLRDVAWWVQLEPAFQKTRQAHSADLGLRPPVLETLGSKNQDVESALVRGVQFFHTLQCADGHWPGDYGGPHFLLPGLVMVCHACGHALPYPQKVVMAAYMLQHQNEDGGWGLHIESPSTLFGTGMQYVALRLLGIPAEDPRLQKALHWIQSHGGITAIPSWGKFYLAILGLLDWRGVNPLLPELWLLPRWMPIHPSRIWCHARMVYLPMSYAYGRRFVCAQDATLEALRQELYPQGYDRIRWNAVRYACCPEDVYHKPTAVMKVANALMRGFEKLGLKRLRKKGLDFAFRYICAEDVQTRFIDIGPVNKVLNMLCVCIEKGSQSPEFQRHTERLDDYLWWAEDGLKMNGYNGSQLWDTAFAARALAEAQHPVASEALRAAFRYLDFAQVKEEVPMQKEFFRHPSVGGWPFSTPDHGWPITDCTSEALDAALAIARLPFLQPFEGLPKHRLQLAADLILSFQNRDGGWASYELTRGPRWLEWLNPSEVFSAIMIDYSYTECSSSCIQALCAFHQEFPEYRSSEILKAIRRGVDFILSKQNEEGLWYGSWGVCFTYGTWFASQALSAASALLNPDVRRASESALARMAAALASRQNPDGGWGEHYTSCLRREWVNHSSQVIQTAWAVLSLLNTPHTPLDRVKHGLRFILESQAPHGDWPQQQISGVFNKTCMITYANYRNIFPLWALGKALRMGIRSVS
ncbi:MAG: terpene cyclase/mutase family protein [Flavobacteriales bacterium]|nr:terpene cyclase/mutase family protein [Flavobacteriales bacterium]